MSLAVSQLGFSSSFVGMGAICASLPARPINLGRVPALDHFISQPPSNDQIRPSWSSQRSTGSRHILAAAPTRGGVSTATTVGPGGLRGSGGGGPIQPGHVFKLPRGGMIVYTSAGWLQIGVPMWTNKDARWLYDLADGSQASPEQIPHIMPTIYIFDLDYVPATDGLIPADFLQYMNFVTRTAHNPKGITFEMIAPDNATARRLEDYLNLVFLGPDDPDLSERVRQEYPPGATGVPDLLAEMHQGFPAAAPDVLRRIHAMDANNGFATGQVTVRKIGSQLYEVQDGTDITQVDLAQAPIRGVNLAQSLPSWESPAHEDVWNGVVKQQRPGIWPIGTGHGFTADKETSGFIIFNGGRALLVDPPSNTDEFLVTNQIPLAMVHGALLTHGHTDHYGNAIPKLISMLPSLKLYTTPTIYDMLQEQYALSLGANFSGGLGRWTFDPIAPQEFKQIIGMHFRPEYTFHSIPTLGFDIYRRPVQDRGERIVMFTGDTNADHERIFDHTQTAKDGTPPLMSYERAQNIIRHVDGVLMPPRGARPPVVLIDNGIEPLHTPPAATQKLLVEAIQRGIDVSRIRVYHIDSKEARRHGLPEWLEGWRGFIDLSQYFQRFRSSP